MSASSTNSRESWTRLWRYAKPRKGFVFFLPTEVFGRLFKLNIVTRASFFFGNYNIERFEPVYHTVIHVSTSK